MTQPGIIRLLIVDEHESVRLGLTTALAIVDDLLVVGAVATGQEALELCSRLQPDVVLMEIQLSDRDGVGVIQSIREQFPWIQVIVLTTAPATTLRQRARSVGARDFLPKYVALDRLIAVIRAASAQSRAQGDGR